MADDVILDILNRVRAICAAEGVECKLQTIELEVREYWGGERPYIAKQGESTRASRTSVRDRRIREQHSRGEHVQLLARRWDLSPRRIQQIIRG